MFLGTAQACLEEIEELRRSGAGIDLLNHVEQIARDCEDYEDFEVEIREAIAGAWADGGNLETAACIMPMPNDDMSESEKARNQRDWARLKNLAEKHEPLSDIMQIRLAQAP